MDNQAPHSPSIPERLSPTGRKTARPAARRGSPVSARNLNATPADWQGNARIVDQMLAYSDWWNIPAAARKHSSSR